MGLNIGASGHRGIGTSDPVANKTGSRRTIRSSENRANSIPKSSKTTTSASLELHIEELVLHGFPPSDRLRIGDAVERELLRLITEQGLPRISANPLNLALMDVGSFQIAHGTTAQGIGVQLAQHLHRRLSPEQRPATPDRPFKEKRGKE